ncbi:glycerophosphodiester phosphodiesterase family protein [Luxibacter massiliensis]|uniref:glycerophosphodiester phosphodiesterase family protein n=1 Tax=Luxibacter massiliensis TaxID=2219695 RepID=UPI000F04DAD4|nr:glycerophosphodiester phosphodiesterase family protein [Luxibacter massiliensis]
MYLLGIIAVMLVLLYLFMIMPRMSTHKRMKLFLGTKWAHRGLYNMKKGIPENSLAAFKNAVKKGVGIELDVHMTCDKKLIVFHDDTLKRVCGCEGNIEEMAYEDLKGCYLNHTSEKIPLLSDVLDYVNGRVPLLIEVKLPTKNTEICSYLEKELRRYNGPYLVQSFNCLVLRWLKMYCPQILRGQLSSNLTKSSNSPNYLLRFCVQHLLSNCWCRPDFISYKLRDSQNLSLRIVHRLYHAPVAAWTIRTAEEMAAAKKEYDMYIFEQKQ